MSVLKPEYNECGVMTAYVNSQGHLQHVAADRYDALRKRISLRIIKRMKRSAQKPDKIGLRGMTGPSDPCKLHEEEGAHAPSFVLDQAFS
jgi:hypothetical protein